MKKKIFCFLILYGLALNLTLCLAWFLEEPNPDRLGYWYIIFFLIHPALGLLGVLSLLLHNQLRLSWWVGTILLGHLAIAWAVIILINYVFLLLPNFSYEWFYSLLSGLSLIAVITAMLKS